MKHHNITRKTVPRETMDATNKLIQKKKHDLEEYFDQLLWWNSRVNLVSRDVPRETIWEHIRHSVIIANLPPFQEEQLFIDTGTGGGLPGIPLAITHPDKHFILNDLVTKKCLAIKQIAQKIGLQNIGILDGSIEKVELNEAFTLISKHAFKIQNLYGLSTHLPWKRMILYKGIDFENELLGIDSPLDITAIDLSPLSDFYKGKAILIIERP